MTDIKSFSGVDKSPKVQLLEKAKSLGFSDRQIANFWNCTESEILALRQQHSILPAYRLVDTCAAEFEAATPYYYSSYDRTLDESRISNRKKIMILGGGPNRIGQGIEFDYCCVHAAFALREIGFQTIMVNSNPETVSTDYDTSDLLFFEPLTFEDVIHIYERQKCFGAIVQLGGQTPLNLAASLRDAGVHILGTSVESIELAEDRKHFASLLRELGLKQPPNATATSEEEALRAAQQIGYPVLVRPSFVLGGRAMQIVYTPEDLRHYMRHAVEASPERPVLVDRFLDDAIEVDVDCIADGRISVIGGIMQHIEEAGIHSGDSACVIPTYSLSDNVLAEIRRASHALAARLKVCGLMNIQFAVKDEVVYILEVNPRASRTAPFVSKTIGVSLPRLAAKVMAGMTLDQLGFTKEIIPRHYAVKEAVFPFNRFPGVDTLLGPEMKSTGEVMGIDANLGIAYAKSQMAANAPLPLGGKVFISVRDRDKPAATRVAAQLVDQGLEICATTGTAAAIQQNGTPCLSLLKISEGRPNVLDMILNREIKLIINTPAGASARQDERHIRSLALEHKIPIITTMPAAAAAALGIQEMKRHGFDVRPIQQFHREIACA